MAEAEGRRSRPAPPGSAPRASTQAPRKCTAAQRRSLSPARSPWGWVSPPGSSPPMSASSSCSRASSSSAAAGPPRNHCRSLRPGPPLCLSEATLPLLCPTPCLARPAQPRPRLYTCTLRPTILGTRLVSGKQPRANQRRNIREAYPSGRIVSRNFRIPRPDTSGRWKYPVPLRYISEELLSPGRRGAEI
jgi:hypothetical protein